MLKLTYFTSGATVQASLGLQHRPSLYVLSLHNILLGFSSTFLLPSLLCPRYCAVVYQFGNGILITCTLRTYTKKFILRGFICRTIFWLHIVSSSFQFFLLLHTSPSLIGPSSISSSQKAESSGHSIWPFLWLQLM